MNEKPGSQLIAALLKARDEFKPIKKDAENPFFHSKYATLATYIDATEPALRKNGLIVKQEVNTIDAGLAVLVTTIRHVSGEDMVCGSYPVTPSKQDPQGMGSATTYVRRYSYAAALNLASEDDDANEASKKQEQPAKKVNIPARKADTVDEDQRRAIFATAKEEGHSKETVLAIIKELFNADSTADVPADGFDELIARMKGGA